MGDGDTAGKEQEWVLECPNEGVWTAVESSIHLHIL